ncbi:MAG TPA: pitrilysin family protein [Labilithrix sp.]|jgi:predicted Zn-dependent peptidase|nr:pitrilysin family protein [Labilithrix sp.]
MSSDSMQAEGRSATRAKRYLPGALCVLALAGGCGAPKVATTGPAKVELPATDGLAKRPAPGREAPPSSGTTKESPFPQIARSTLPSGMGVAVITARALPIVQVRLVVHAGANYGGAPGVGELTAQMLKDGGTRSMSSSEVLRRVETLGADLSVRSETDVTVLGMALTKDKVSEGLALLSQVAREPRFDAGELKKLKARSIDEVEDAARSNGSWTATHVLFHELYPDKHPYETHGLTPSSIAKIDGAQIREFHRKFFVPKNATLVVAGDIDDASATDLARRHFGGWTGGEPPKVDFPAPKPPTTERVFIAHRPKSVQSDVFVTMLAPERRSERWALVRVANQILGGGVASRLFNDVREQRSLAYRTSSQILELAHGPQPLVLYAGTESSKTAEAALGLIENIDKMTTSPPSPEETEIARRYLSDIFAIRMETIGSIAEMVVTQETFGLPDGYWDTYRKQLRGADPREVAEIAPKLFGAKKLVVVAGDADVIGSELARFGEVTVVDPEKEFKTIKTIPAAAAGK